MKRKSFKFLEMPFQNFNIEIMANGLYEGDPSWNFPDVISPFNRIYFVLSGEGFLENEDHEIRLTPQNVYLIPAGSKYSYRCDKKIIKLYFHFNLQILPGMDIFDGLRQCIFMPCSMDTINQLLTLLEGETLTGLVRFQSIFSDLIAGFMEKAVDEYALEWEYKSFVKYAPVLSYISDHLYADLKMKDIADRIGISYYALSRNFKQDTGIGIKQYTEKMLLKKAKQLLVTTNLNINEISEKFHFCDPYYFSRFFKKYEEVSPTQYRKRHVKSFDMLDS